jgi:hypothetical protein
VLIRSKAVFFAILTLSIYATAQKEEFSFSVGAVATSDQPLKVEPCNTSLSSCVQLNYHTSTGVAFEGSYAREIWNFKGVSLGAEFPVAGVPGRDVTFSVINNPNVTESQGAQSSVFFTPSARFKFLPSRLLSPFVSVGGGLAHHGTVFGSIDRGTLQFGGGLDIKTPIPHFAVRTDIRDFWENGEQKSPVSTNHHQHNVLATVGVVFRF